MRTSFQRAPSTQPSTRPHGADEAKQFPKKGVHYKILDRYQRPTPKDKIDINGDKQDPSLPPGYLTTYDPLHTSYPISDIPKDLKDEALKQALREACAKHDVISYSEARSVIFRTLDNIDGKVTCVYTGRQQPGGSSGSMNVEHSWPQSKGAKGAAKSDLYHLFPTDVDANGVRSSYPFGEVESVQWEQGGSKLGTDAHGRQVFEPRKEHRGNVARALFYFSVVYDLPIPNEDEAVLRKWNEEDPVDDAERERCAGIEKIQKNEQPFVEDPTLADRIKDF